MTEVTLHPAPRWRDVMLEQVRIVGLSLRIAGLLVAAVLAVGTVMIGVDLVGGGRGFDADDTFPTALISFLLPFAVWKNDRPFRPVFLWTLPVDRRQLALAKVFAGLVWLTAALTIFLAWLLALGLLAGVSPALTFMRVPFGATIATYLFGSALVVGLRYPLRWLLGAAGVFFLVGSLSQALESYSGVQSLLGSSDLYYATENARNTWQTLPGLARWALGTFLPLGAGLAALWPAASRHKENR
ncbi:MAG TPA: hypothetical protein VF432_04095 [Thermoanaerobaculia bacterium]